VIFVTTFLDSKLRPHEVRVSPQTTRCLYFIQWLYQELSFQN